MSSVIPSLKSPFLTGVVRTLIACPKSLTFNHDRSFPSVTNVCFKRITLSTSRKFVSMTFRSVSMAGNPNTVLNHKMRSINQTCNPNAKPFLWNPLSPLGRFYRFVLILSYPSKAIKLIISTFLFVFLFVSLRVSV